MAAAPEDIPLDPAAMNRVGVVASVDLATARVTVLYGDPDGEEVESPPLRWLMPRSGDTRIWSPPSIGEQGLILAPEGDIAGAVFLPGLTRDSFPPAGSTSEEAMLFADGARIAYDPEGHVLNAELPEGATVNITADQVNITGPVSISGSVAIDGDVTVSGTLTADTDVVGGGKSLKGHKHTGVTAGGGVSGAPQ
jgi:phage baseplate assembly protein V